MASLSEDAPKKWRILFMCPATPGKRRQIYFSGYNAKRAETFFNIVERLIEARSLNTTIQPQDAAWLAELPDKMYGKLVRNGLVQPRVVAEPEPEPDRLSLAAFLQDHIDHGRTSTGKKAAVSTLAKWIGTQRFLEVVFPHRDLESITAEDAHQFRVWLDKRRIKQTTSGRKGLPMAENAKRKHIANCKMFFNAAKRRGLISSNPFNAQVSGTQANRSRDYYVTPEETVKLLAVAPDAQWRLLIALWRLAGLRKMEVFNLTWGDVLHEQGKLRVRSTKTEHREGCEQRYVPIRDVARYLEDAFQNALPDGKHTMPADEPIIRRFSASNSNLDKPFKAIIESAGLVPWAKLFQNMRSSCETQWLKDGERADLVANWMGHSVKVQRQNYVQHTQEDIEAFNQRQSLVAETKNNADSNAEAAGHEVTRRETTQKATHTSSARNQEPSVFATQTRSEHYPEQDSNLQPAA